MDSQIESHYPLIGQSLYEALPNFSEGWLSIEMLDDVWGAEAFYRPEPRENENEIRYINCGLEKLERLFIGMRESFKRAGMQPFTQATFWLSESGKFSIEFGYEDVSDFGMASDRRDEWIKKHLGESARINWRE